MLSLAGPIALIQFGMVSYGTVDTLLMGRLGPVAIAGVGLAGAVIMLLVLFGVGLLLGVDTLSSRAFGAGRPEVCARVAFHAMALALCGALPIFLLLGAAEPAFRLAGVAPDVASTAVSYLRVYRWSVFASLLFAASRQYLQSMNITRPQLAAVVAGNAVNIGLGVCLVFGKLGLPALGVQGIAWATLVSVWLMCAVCGWAVLKEFRAAGFRFHGWHWMLFVELLRIGLPAGTQMLIEMGVFSLVTVLAGRLGAVPLAAHQITLNLASITFMVPLGVSLAAAVRVGQGIGRNDPSGAVRSGTTALALGAGFMALAGLLFLALPGLWIGLYTRDAAVGSLGATLLAIAAVFQVCDGMQVSLTGALRGLGETRLPMLANLVGHWGVGLPIGMVLGFKLGWGVRGLWVGLCAGLITVALSLLLVWRRAAARLLDRGRQKAAGAQPAGNMASSPSDDGSSPR